MPLLVVAFVAFIAGIAVGGGSAELDSAKRFLAAWEEGDFEAMHAELTPGAAADYPLESFTGLYEDASMTATATSVDTGEAQGPAGDEVEAPATVKTDAFGEVTGTVTIPVADGAVAWRPDLVFPGLEPGEELDRRTRAPPRAAILAADGAPLAKGPSSARTSPLGPSALDIAGEMGAAKGEQRAAALAAGFPPGTLVGTSGLELAFDARLAGQPAASFSPPARAANASSPTPSPRPASPFAPRSSPGSRSPPSPPSATCSAGWRSSTPPTVRCGRWRGSPSPRPSLQARSSRSSRRPRRSRPGR